MGNKRLLAFWRKVWMPWKGHSLMEERLRFVARLLDGEGMTAVRRAFGILRKTGYKISNWYRPAGVETLCDCPRRPVRYANQLPQQVERLIVETKKDKPHWAPATSARSTMAFGS